MEDSDLMGFQRRFLRAAFKPNVRTAALSIPRGNGKSTLTGYILSLCMTPGHRWHVHGAEYVLGAASIEQARHVFRSLRTELEGKPDYRFIDSVQRLGCVHKPTNTRIRVQSSSGRQAMGLVGCPLIVLDEPGALHVKGGELLHAAIQTAQGKPESALRAIYIGTLAPAEGGWWPDLVHDGSKGLRAGVHVTALQGREDRWHLASEIRRCNPLMWKYAASRKVLLEERDEALRDSSLKARFLSYRLNLPSADAATMLLTAEDWAAVLAREAPERPDAPPVVAVDLGGGRAWSAAVAGWGCGRVEALAVCPGIPDIAQQEKRDRVPKATYGSLIDKGQLRMAEGLQVPPPSQLWRMIVDRWGHPRAVLCDRFRFPELADAIQGAVPLVPRVTRWSEAAADIRALRKWAKDGCLSVPAGGGRGLLTASLGAAMVENDTSGNFRMVKKDANNNTARDDVAAALALLVGALEREAMAERARPDDNGWDFG